MRAVVCLLIEVVITGLLHSTTGQTPAVPAAEIRPSSYYYELLQQ